MKKNFISKACAAIALASALTACAPQEQHATFHISGTTGETVADSTLLFLTDSKGNLLDSCLVVEGAFTFSGNADSVMVTAIGCPGQRPKISFFAEEGNISIDLTERKATGTPLNDDYTQFIAHVMSVEDALQEEAEKNGAEELYLKHKNDLLGVRMFNTLAYYYNYDELKAALDSACDEIKNNPTFLAKLESKKAAEETAVGQKYVDITGINILTGDSLSLSSYIGKKLTLIDFWASWCGPCRREIPNIAKVAEKYKRQLNVVGIAVWDQPHDTKRAMKELNITWPVIFERSASEPYGVLGIPHLVLIDKDGTILARGFHGEGIEAAVKEALKK